MSRVFHKPIARASKERCTFKGITYHSRTEMMYAAELDLEVRNGDYEVMRQVKFYLGCLENCWTVDFEVQSEKGERFPLSGPLGTYLHTFHRWVVDVMGFDTAEKRRWVWLWRNHGPCPLVLLKRKGSGWTRTVVLPDSPTRKGKR